MQQHPWVGVDEGTVPTRELASPVVVEPDRNGEGDKPDCSACGSTPDDFEVYRDDLWRVRALRGSAFPGTCMLTPLSHVDGLRNLGDAELASYGPMVARIERALLALPTAVTFRGAQVARVHSHLWNDGGAHLHQWFFPRPYGYVQMLGSTLVEWEETLPRATDEQALAAAGALRDLLTR